MRQKMKVIIDTDPGIDDFFALIMAAGSENLDIMGITAVAGNQTMDKIAANALGIAELLELDAPVSKGAYRPLLAPQITASVVHGETGLGNFELPEPKRQFDGRYAWDMIYDIARENPGEVTLIAIGPLTNVAIALMKYPDLNRLLPRIIAMGGSTGWGNRGAYGEFNFYVDPLAAQLVFNSGIPVDMVGLNVTMQTGMSQEEFDELSRLKCRHVNELMHLLDFYRDIYRKNDLGFNIVAMHDSLAVAYAIDPSLLKMREGYVQVDVSGGPCRGRSIVDWHDTPNARVAVEVDKDRFLNLVKESFQWF